MVRDAAVARLTVIGARAEAVLAGLAGDRKAPPAARLAALRVLEATAAPAGCELGLAQLDDPAEDIVRAAIAAYLSTCVSGLPANPANLATIVSGLPGRQVRRLCG